ncbi:hypothetical protein [Devosia rhizoryzae]|uniref:Secreted protein n=1 Tax=Devosia rhizoryzae TaxID=2774137 RepID=A0ABX7C501_9HYPH|nr:hypothetical protein [Devosia rhizoryzae]QQR39300.1 hypothetical protein JI748_16500 [Devosia rhizoryzae]
MLVARNAMFAVSLGLMLAGLPQLAIAQVDPNTPAGVQDAAPAGGLTVQEGVTTEATKCPDGSEPVLNDGMAGTTESPAEPTAEADQAPTETSVTVPASETLAEDENPAGENEPYLCPDTDSQTTGADADSEDAVKGPVTPSTN